MGLGEAVAEVGVLRLGAEHPERGRGHEDGDGEPDREIEQGGRGHGSGREEEGSPLRADVAAAPRGPAVRDQAHPECLVLAEERAADPGRHLDRARREHRRHSAVADAGRQRRELATADEAQEHGLAELDTADPDLFHARRAGREETGGQAQVAALAGEHEAPPLDDVAEHGDDRPRDGAGDERDRDDQGDREAEHPVPPVLEALLVEERQGVTELAEHADRARHDGEPREAERREPQPRPVDASQHGLRVGLESARLAGVRRLAPAVDGGGRADGGRRLCEQDAAQVVGLRRRERVEGDPGVVDAGADLDLGEPEGPVEQRRLEVDAADPVERSRQLLLVEQPRVQLELRVGDAEAGGQPGEAAEDDGAGDRDRQHPQRPVAAAAPHADDADQGGHEELSRHLERVDHQHP